MNRETIVPQVLSVLEKKKSSCFVIDEDITLTVKKEKSGDYFFFDLEINKGNEPLMNSVARDGELDIELNVLLDRYDSYCEKLNDMDSLERE